MAIDCDHWSPGSDPGAGTCALGFYLGRPLERVCQDVCAARTSRKASGTSASVSVRVATPIGKSDAPRPGGAGPSIAPATPALAPAPPAAKALRTIAHGAAGIARALTGTGGADESLIASRTAICAGCEHAQLVAGRLQRCGLCGCATWAKVRNRTEHCPVGKW
jgi:hypothetical protein